MPALAGSQSMKTGDVFVDSLKSLEFSLAFDSSTFDEKFADGYRHLVS